MSEPAENEEELNRVYKQGIESGLKQAANFLLEQAATNFKASRDEIAKVLRGLYHELLTKACAAGPDDDGDDYHPSNP